MFVDLSGLEGEMRTLQKNLTSFRSELQLSARLLALSALASEHGVEKAKEILEELEEFLDETRDA